LNIDFLRWPRIGSCRYCWQI